MRGTALRAARARKNRRRRCVLLALLAHMVACGRVVGAQEALVLSGGGAKGLAHVGVISGMEELGYDADIVIGTSMGAVVGALYAAGYSPAEITERVLEIDWAEVFLPTPLVLGPDRAVRYPLISFDLRVDDLRFARGLIGQWRINRALAHLLFDANARARGNFDRLARRYRAITADLETGDVVVLAKGDLALAARASMAVPGIFAPIVWDGKVLVDGGITDNLPTGVARRMGADEIIAVDVGRPPPTIVDESPWGIMQRALDLMQENTQRDPLPPDHLIVPELAPRFRGASFPANPLAIFAIGREAALRDLPTRVAGPPRERRVPTPPTWFDRLEVEAPDTALEELARRVFEDVAPGPYDPAAVSVAVDRLYSTGLLEGVWPRVEEDPFTGEAVLLVRLDAPPRLSVSAAPGYENDRGGRAWVSLSRFTSLRDRPVVLTAAASTTGVERWAMLSTQLYARNRSALSMSVGAHARESDIRDFLEDAVRDRDAVRLGASATLEFPHILQDQLTSLALSVERIDVEGGVTGSAYGPILRFSRVNPVNLVIGTPFLAEVEHRFGSVSYSRLAVRASRVFGGAGFGFGPIVDFRWTSQDAPEDVWSALGDDHAVPGFRWGEMRARSRLVAGLDATQSIRSAHLRLRARLGAVTHELAEIDRADWISGGQVALVWRSPLGSVEVGYGHNTKGKRRIDVSLGRSF